MVPNFEKIMHVNSSLTDYSLNESSFTMRSVDNASPCDPSLTYFWGDRLRRDCKTGDWVILMRSMCREGQGTQGLPSFCE